MIPVLSPRPPETDRRSGAADAGAATVAYAILTLAMTWPLALGLSRDVPGDFGDPLLNAWIVAWDARHILDALGGHLLALRDYWQANIFFPHPLALTYSEHLTMQAIEALPVYALTHNPLLCYNLVFLSTFVLSGLGGYLLACEFTGSRIAGFVAGLAYAFAPYRFGTLAHIQVLSSSWMPFTLYALHRYFDGQRPGALAGAVAAFVAQALSCGYYLLFFTPVVVLFMAWEIGRGRRWRDRTMWTQLLIGGAVTAALVLPFLIPYVAARGVGMAPRTISEADHFAADVYAYLTADVQLRLWGGLVRAWPRPEGSLFPGLTISGLAIIAAVRAWRRERLRVRPTIGLKLLEAAFAATVAVGAGVLLAGAVRLHLGPLAFKATDLDRVLAALLLLVAGLMIWRTKTAEGRTVRPYARQAAAWLRTPAAIMTIVLAFALVMSLGPHVHSRGKLVDDANLYLWFFRHVPGYDGLRVPARFAMIAAMALAALAADAIAHVPAGRQRAIAMCAALLILAESWSAPILLNYADPAFSHGGLVAATEGVAVIPPIYEAVRRTPEDAVILELPIGEPEFDARAMYFSTSHWRRLVNGYSGSAPVDYALLAEDLNDLFRAPDRAWAALERSGATHMVVHEGAYAGTRGARVSAWALSHGARELGRAGSDRLFIVR